MNKIVLCIDDEPIRYRELRNLLAKDGIVVVTTCRLEDFFQYMDSPYEIVGVCLDHDMPFQSGMYFAGVLRQHNYPVVITSLNNNGAKNISYHLDEYETPNIILPCTKEAWEHEAILFWEVTDD